MSRKTKIIVSVVALLVIAGAAGVFALRSQGSGPEVDTAKVTRQRLDVTVSASGDVVTGIASDLYAPTATTIDTIYVSDGATVTAGDKIAQLDTTGLETQLASAKAQLSSAKAQYDNAGTAGGVADVDAAKAGVRAANAQLSAANAQLSAARAAQAQAKDAYTAAAKVYPSGSPTVTAALTATKQADAGVASAKAGVASAKAGVASAKAGLSKAKSAAPASSKAAAAAALEAANSAVDAAQDAIDKCTLVAPIDGRVVYNAMSASLTGDGDKPKEGSSVTPQSAPFSVIDLSALSFEADVDEADVERVKAGLGAEISLDALPGVTITTSVTRIDPVAKTTSTGGTVFVATLPVEGVADRDVYVGMKGDATIKLSSTGEAITIPIEALFSEGGTDFAYVVKAGTLQKTELVVGATTDTEVEVTSGLEPGQVVALSGTTQYTDGMSVRVQGQ